MSTSGADLRHVVFEGRPARPQRDGRGPRPPHARGVRHVRFVNTRDDSTARGFPAFVLGCVGLDASAYRDGPLQRRMPACLRALRCPDEAWARELVARSPEALAVALNHLLIGVTGAFRDEHVFETIRERVLPQLACRRRLCVWSAGCANGAELMSMAVLLEEAGLLTRTALLGTDCRAEALAQAASGSWRKLDLPVRFRGIRHAAFAQTAGSGWPAGEWLPSTVQWRRADLTSGVEAGPWDLVLWRNVAIYLTPETSSRITRGIAQELAPGGFLVLGKAERPSLEGLVPLQRCVYQKEERVAG